MATKSTTPDKNKRKNEVPPGGQRVPRLDWPSLEDISDHGTDWPKAINRVAAAACKCKTADEIFRQIGEELGKLSISSVFLIREAAGENLLISNVAISSKGLAVYPARALRVEKSRFMTSTSEIISRVLASGDVVLTTDPDEGLRKLFPGLTRDDIAAAVRLAFICAPLGNAGGAFGVLVAVAPGMTHGQAHNVALLAHIASMSHARSFMVKDMNSMREQIESLDKGLSSALDALDKSLHDVVHALTAPLEKRDPYTFGHQTRVTRLAVAIAEEMGMTKHRIDGLRMASSVHDIGKIAVPFEILNRPTKLSETEFMLIKMHPQVAFDMIRPITFRWPVAEIVRQHHERADGSGYPRGLKSGEMLLEARILAVADVVEAMSSHRPYRSALGIDAALEEVSGKSGTLYDAEAVAACIRLLLIKNFSLDGGEAPSPWQSANPFMAIKTGAVN